jgi:hypothetical protein
VVEARRLFDEPEDQPPADDAIDEAGAPTDAPV